MGRGKFWRILKKYRYKNHKKRNENYLNNFHSIFLLIHGINTKTRHLGIII